MRLLLTGGGTAGHVYPGLAVLAALRREPQLEVIEPLYLGTARGIESTLAARAGIPFATVSASGLRGKLPWEVASAIGGLTGGLWQAYRAIQRFRPDVVLATGGYVSMPVVLAARARAVPTVLYLPDVEPGLAVKALARLVAVVAVSHAASRRLLPHSRVTVTGYPVREDFVPRPKDEARRRLGLNPEEATLLVWGGSTGARSINDALLACLADLLQHCQIVLLCGERDETRAQQAREALDPALRQRYHPYAYLHEELPWVLSAADLVVGRAGASALGELPAMGLPAVLVPYPFAGAHQRRNAEVLVEAGGAVLLDDAHLDRLRPVVEELLTRPARLAQMAERQRDLYRPGATQRLASLLLEVAGAASAFGGEVAAA